MKPIDRLAPIQRPSARVVMRMAWRDLLFLHWEFAPEIVQKQLPDGLELDLFEGRAFVGLVPFRMSEVRPFFAPPLGSRIEEFPELNVRTYVVRAGVPGVWFFSLDCGSSLSTIAARTWFALPYFRARMRICRLASGATRYESRRLWPPPLPARCHVRFRPEGEFGEARVAEFGSLEHFLVERYVLYSQRGQQIFRGRVHHQPYELQNAQIEALREDCVFRALGARPQGEPHVLFARGMSVEAFGLERA